MAIAMIKPATMTKAIEPMIVKVVVDNEVVSSEDRINTLFLHRNGENWLDTFTEPEMSHLYSSLSFFVLFCFGVC